MTAVKRKNSKGVSLLEMLVALSIMSFSLVMIYRAVGGSARGVQQVEASQGASMLAESLLDAYRGVAAAGVQQQGEDGIYTWQIQSQPYSDEGGIALQRLHIAIQWPGQHSFVISTLRPVHTPSARGTP